MSFAAAFAALPAPAKGRVETQLAAWRSGLDACWAQVVRNVETETALPVAAFTSLLATFADALVAGAGGIEAWSSACHRHQFMGTAMLPPAVPSVLGRAMALEHYANNVHTAVTHLSTAQAARLLRKNAGRLPRRGDAQLLRQALLGKHVVWATFNDAAGDTNPFDRLPRTTEHILAAMGLGCVDPTETMVLLAYGREIAGTTLSLHRPTVAEAAEYPCYRPHTDPAHPHGYTAPLPPNPAGLAPQPEVVHRSVPAASLIFPYHLTTP